jgi:hypothetical protein
MSDRRTLICLRGGLGNQLFQFAYANRIAKGTPLGFVTDIGQPSTTNQGIPELFGLLQPSEYRFCVNIKSVLLTKILNFSLRKSSKSESSILAKGLEILGSLFLFRRFKRTIRIQTGKGLGYFCDSKERKGTLLNGYFQSHKWMDAQYFKTQILSIDFTDQRFLEYIKDANDHRILAVHVRLGDYKLFDEFGVLPRTYYDDAISEMMKLSHFDRIWLFSNDLDLAREFIPEIYTHLVSEVPLQFTSVETLQIMRLAHCYIIGNSTFSWWGATLSLTDNASVIAPNPWFDKMVEPIDLIPPHWKRMNR